MNEVNDENYFFSDWENYRRGVLIPARGWGDDGKRLKLPRDTYFIAGHEVRGTYYQLYHSSEMNLWYILRYQENQYEWHGGPLTRKDGFGKFSPITDEDDVRFEWEHFLKERALQHELNLILEQAC